MKQLKNMLLLLFYKGDIQIVNQYKNIAVIRSRKFSAEGHRFSYDAGETTAGEPIFKDFVM